MNGDSIEVVKYVSENRVDIVPCLNGLSFKQRVKSGRGFHGTGGLGSAGGAWSLEKSRFRSSSVLSLGVFRVGTLRSRKSAIVTVWGGLATSMYPFCVRLIPGVFGSYFGLPFREQVTLCLRLRTFSYFPPQGHSGMDLFGRNGRRSVQLSGEVVV